MTNAVNIAQSGSNNVTFRNKIINGAMVINQRGTSSSTSSTNGTYPADRTRWYAGVDGTGTVGANMGGVTPPAGFTNYIGYTQGSSATTISSGTFFAFFQAIEGYNIADWAWGTANAKSVTVSFWVYSNLTGTFSASLRNSAHTYGYPFNYTISSANTWTQVSAVVTGPTVGVWETTNGTGTELYIAYGTGSNYTGTANTWNAGNIAAVTGATNLVATANAYLYVTGIQIELGTTASPFEYRQYGTELALCQRYYNMVANYSQTGGVAPITNIVFPSATDIRAIYNFPVQMRVAPSVVSSSGSLYFRIYNGNNIYANSIGLDFASVSGIGIVSGGGTSGATQGQGGIIFANTAGAYFALSAEL